jgi:DNA helicase-2/ATP-dependent DNA helicase PcrA
MFYDLLWDEYEDVGWLTHEIFLRLPVLNRFVTACPQQSIFGWRSARPDCVRRWANLLPPQAQFTLNTNYRCGPTICAHASRLLPGPMTPASEHADYVHVQQFWRDGLEIQAIASDILSKPRPEDCAVLFRTNALLTKYRLLLMGSGVPVALEAPKTRPDDYERVVAYLRRMATPSCEAPRYDWNTVGDTIVGVSADMVDIVNGAKLNLQPHCSLWEIIAEMQYLDLGVANAARLVHTSTIHAAKGLEFDYVYLPAFEQGIIPSAAKSACLEEEGRLAYVALTRARKGVWISYCDERAKTWGNSIPQPASPSQFIKDMTGQISE